MESCPRIDADQHYYEPLDAFTRHLPAGWSERTVRIATVEGRVRLIVAGRLVDSIPNPTFNPAVKPGAMVDYFRGNPQGRTLKECLSETEPLPESYHDREARLQTMDEQGLEAIWLMPTLGMGVEELLQDDPTACGVAFRSFNEWMLDDWGFDFRGRIFAAPYLAMGDVAVAIETVEWALDRGARLFTVRPTGTRTPAGWRSPGDECFDPVWARLDEASAVILPHTGSVGGFGLDRFDASFTNFVSNEAPPLQVAVGHDRPISNYFGAVICDRVFERFPRLRMASIENGSDFVPLLLKGLRRAASQRPGYFAADPLETFRRHCWVAPFWEDDLEETIDILGADRVLFGSDWPHPEGLVEPRDFEDLLTQVAPPGTHRLVMHDNSAALMRPMT